MRKYLVPLSLLLVGACSPSDPTGTEGDRFGTPDAVVQNGGSIQAAVDDAAPGSVIHVEAGTYAEAIRIEKAGIKLVGRGGPVVIVNPGGEDFGIAVRSGGDDVALVGLTVRGFERSGVLLREVSDFLVSGMTAEDNGAYGFFPILTTGGVIERSVSSGHFDSGFYVGQSRDVTVRRNTAFRNLKGIEIENASGIRVLSNEVHDNVVGILAMVMLGRRVRVAADNVIADNVVRGNNLTGETGRGSYRSDIPPGMGVLVLGTERTVVERNQVSGNELAGIAVASMWVFGALVGWPPDIELDIAPDPAGTRIRNNDVRGNGTGAALPLFPAADVTWDGAGPDNCWGGNRFDTSAPAVLPACGR